MNEDKVINDTQPEKGQWLERMLFGNRNAIMIVLALATLFLGYHAFHLRPEASFLKMIPTKHSYIQNYLKYQDDLQQLGNVVRIVVETTEGDIFSSEYLEELRKINDEVFFINGVNRGVLQSLWTPTTRWMEVNAEGFSGGPVIPDSYDGSQQSRNIVKFNVMRSGQIGKLVANNFKSSVVLAPLLDVDPKTGKKLDYWKLAGDLENIRTKYEKGHIKVRILGFVKIVGDMIDGLIQVVMFFVTAVFITLGILYFYFKGMRSAVMPVICAIIAVVWQLGALRLLGFGLDPYSMLVPFLIFAVGVSHGVQMINRFQGEFMEGSCDKLTAAKNAFHHIYIPSFSALVTDGFGFATLMVIQIVVIQDLSIGASMGVLILIITNLVMLPLLMSYVGVSAKVIKRIQEDRTEKKHPVMEFLCKFTIPKWAVISVLLAAILYGWGIWYSRALPIGDLDAGAPELRADSRYNLDNAFMMKNYSTSSDLFVVLVEKKPEPCGEYETLVAIDRLKWELTHLTGVQSVLTMADNVKKVLAGFNEADLKFAALNRNTDVVNNAMQYVDASFVNRTCNLGLVMINLADHKAETLQRVVDLVEEFGRKNNTENLKFLIGAGNSGIEATTNIVIGKAQYTMLIWVYGVVILVILVSFRSIRAVLCIILPLGLTSVLCRVVMLELGIGVKVATLPVIALGVGVGVDYGIYIYDRFRMYRNEGMELSDAYLNTLKTTSVAVALTAVTLAIGVLTWVFSPIKFQADMGLLLTFMFIVNMIGAVVLLPAIASLLWRYTGKLKNNTGGPEKSDLAYKDSCVDERN